MAKVSAAAAVAVGVSETCTCRLKGPPHLVAPNSLRSLTTWIQTCAASLRFRRVDLRVSREWQQLSRLRWVVLLSCSFGELRPGVFPWQVGKKALVGQDRPSNKSCLVISRQRRSQGERCECKLSDGRAPCHQGQNRHAAQRLRWLTSQEPGKSKPPCSAVSCRFARSAKERRAKPPRSGTPGSKTGTIFQCEAKKLLLTAPGQGQSQVASSVSKLLV